MEVREVRENEDGSADYDFDLTDEEAEALFLAGLAAMQLPPLKHTESQYEEAKTALTRLGIVVGIVRGIENVEKSKQVSTPS